MEESEKRRERLREMRMEAAQGGDNSDAGQFMVSCGLSNPLIETSANHQESTAPQRFDYYTDPMSAFSADKRRSKVGQISQDYFTPPRPQNTEMNPSPAQAQISYSSDQGMYQARGLYHNSGPPRSPLGMASPFVTQPGTPTGVWTGAGGTSNFRFQSNLPRGGSFPHPGFGQGDSPSFNSGQGIRQWFSNSPGPGSGRGGSPGFGQGGSPSFNSGQGRGQWFSSSPGPDSGRGGSPSFNSGQGRPHWFSNNPSPGSGRGGNPGPNSGRGRGRWLGNSMSPGSAWNGGRGKGSHNCVSAELRPDLYYNKSMVEDPWKFLKPIIWSENFLVNSLNTADSLKSWLPKSISMKRARVSEASSGSTSQPSLAEYLAASFNEAVSEEAVNDEPNV